MYNIASLRYEGYTFASLSYEGYTASLSYEGNTIASLSYEGYTIASFSYEGYTFASLSYEGVEEQLLGSGSSVGVGLEAAQDEITGFLTQFGWDVRVHLVHANLHTSNNTCIITTVLHMATCTQVTIRVIQELTSTCKPVLKQV